MYILNSILENINILWDMWNSLILIYLGLIIMSIIVLTRVNPMLSLFNLIIFYILLGLLLYKLHLNILGILYILIYVGAISILFIFILSLINIKYIETSHKNNQPDLLIILNSFILTLLLLINIKSDMDLGTLINISDWNINSVMEFKVIGELLYTEYSIIFIILGIILLLSIIAAILLIFRVNIKSL